MCVCSVCLIGKYIDRLSQYYVFSSWSRYRFSSSSLCGICLALFIQRLYCWDTHTRTTSRVTQTGSLKSQAPPTEHNSTYKVHTHIFQWRDEISRGNSSHGGSWNRQLQLLRQKFIYLTDKCSDLQTTTVLIFNLYFWNSFGGWVKWASQTVYSNLRLEENIMQLCSIA